MMIEFLAGVVVGIIASALLVVVWLWFHVHRVAAFFYRWERRRMFQQPEPPKT